MNNNQFRKFKACVVCFDSRYNGILRRQEFLVLQRTHNLKI